jgi:hypothetical protein
MYLRSKEEALDALAEILELTDLRDQLVQSTVKIMLCLDVEPRAFLVDCQAFLFRGGLEPLRRKRQEPPASKEAPPDLDAGPAFEAVASAYDALRFADVVRQVLPDLHHERWQIARAVLVNEQGIRTILEQAIRSRGDAVLLSLCEGEIREMVFALHQPWMDRSGTIRTVCLDGLRSATAAEVDRIHQEADLLFELFATSDERACDLLEAVDFDPVDAIGQVTHLYELAAILRSGPSDSPHDPPGGHGLREVA